MGTFIGHVLPGSFFFIWALWWATQIPRRVLVSRAKNRLFITTVTYPFPKICQRSLPIEGIIKVAATSVGMAAELFASTDYGSNNHVVYWGDIQHVTMYLFFCLSGIVDILQNRKLVFVPLGMDFLAAALAFGIEWMLFSHHLHGRTQLDIILHTLLLNVILATAFVVLLESYYQNTLMLPLSRTFLTLLQGTWFIQVGFILYPPYPRKKAWSDDVTLVSMVFCWHVAGVFIFVGLLYLLLTKLYSQSFTIKELDWDEVDNVEKLTSDDDDADDENETSMDDDVTGFSVVRHQRSVGSMDVLVSDDDVRETWLDGDDVCTALIHGSR